ncbi:MAG: hypothetical protein LWW92_17875 [Rhodocyclales bacterium]|nr:hypothetical protein [Rhodocyclales bacterium]
MTDPYLDRLITDWRHEFASHKAALSPLGEGCQLLRWARPGTVINHVVYILMDAGKVLHVHGDLGEAAFVWYGRGLSLEFLAGCNFDYFMGKCQASEMGLRPHGWDRGKGRADLRKCWKDWQLGLRMRGTKLTQVLKDLDDCSSSAEWEAQVVARLYHDNDLDSEEANILCRVGEVPFSRAVAWWLGLKLAAQQLGVVPA